MSENTWQELRSAPLDGTMVMVNGYTDITQKDKLINIPARWNPHLKVWATRRGQVIFPLKWKPIA